MTMLPDVDQQTWTEYEQDEFRRKAEQQNGAFAFMQSAQAKIADLQHAAGQFAGTVGETVGGAASGLGSAADSQRQQLAAAMAPLQQVSQAPTPSDSLTNPLGQGVSGQPPDAFQGGGPGGGGVSTATPDLASQQAQLQAAMAPLAQLQQAPQAAGDFLQDQQRQLQQAMAPLGQLGSLTSSQAPAAPAGGVNPNPAPGEVQQYIVQAAQRRGIDPNIALRVAQSEGGFEAARRGTFDTGSSWWPFQLHYGGQGYENLGTTAGMGNRFTAETGYQPGDPNAWQAATDYALDEAKKSGWSQWYGARAQGITGYEGIDPNAANVTSRASAVGRAASGGASGWLDLAKEQLNKPYIWGSGSGAGGRGTSDIDPNTGLPKGFDCSGYVSWVMKNGLGVDLPAYTGSAYGKTTAISADQARPGDVVFYNMDNPDPHMQHMALYIGNGQIIQAGGTDRNVNIANVGAVGTPEFRRAAGTEAADSRQLVGSALQGAGGAIEGARGVFDTALGNAKSAAAEGVERLMQESESLQTRGREWADQAAAQLEQAGQSPYAQAAGTVARNTYDFLDPTMDPAEKARRFTSETVQRQGRGEENAQVGPFTVPGQVAAPFGAVGEILQAVSPGTHLGRLGEGITGEVRRDPIASQALTELFDAHYRGDTAAAQDAQARFDARKAEINANRSFDPASLYQAGLNSPDRETAEMLGNIVTGVGATGLAPSGLASGGRQFAASLALDPTGAPFAAAGEAATAGARGLVGRLSPQAAGIIDEGGRMYHGTAGDFPRPDPGRFDPQGLYGPGYYLTDDARVAGGIVADQAIAAPPSGPASWTSVSTSHPYERGDVISEGYAQAAGIKSDPEIIQQTLDASHNFLRENEAKIANLDPYYDARRIADLQEESQRVQDSIPELQQRLANAGQSGPNVRAVDVPGGLNLLDLDAPFDPALEQRLVQAMPTEELREDWRIFSPEPPPNTREMWNRLRTVFGSEGVNDFLSSVGFDGLRHRGGGIRPMVDNATGLPIEHNVRVIFPQSMDKLTNATAGTRGGLLPSATPNVGPLQGAIGGGIGGGIYESQQPDATPGSVARGIVGGAAVGAARGTLARGGVPTGRLAAYADDALREIERRPYNADSITEAYRVVTPQRVETVSNAAITDAAERVAAGRNALPGAEDFMRRVYDEGKRLVQESQVTATGLGPQAARKLAEDGAFTNKFNYGGDEEAIIKATQNIVGKSRLPTREKAWDFVRREGKVGDKMALGSTQAGRSWDEADPDAVARVYAYEAGGEPLVSYYKPAYYLVWEPETPRVVSLHHHFGTGSPGYDVHATMTPGLKRGLWGGTQGESMVRGGEVVPGEMGPDVVNWESSGVPVGGGRTIADTHTLVGAEGAADMRMSTLMYAMPESVIKSIQRGEITDPADVAAVMLRGSPGQIQPASITAGEQWGRKLSDQEKAALRLSAVDEGKRTESLVYDPQLQNIKAIYIPGSAKDLDTPLEGMGGMTRRQLAEKTRQQVLQQTGKDIPVLFKNTDDLVGPDGAVVGSKLISDAETIAGPTGTQLAPGRPEVRSRYMSVGMSDVGQVSGRFAADVGGAAAGGATGWQSTEGQPLPTRVAATAAGAGLGLGAVEGGLRTRGLPRAAAREVERQAALPFDELSDLTKTGGGTLGEKAQSAWYAGLLSSPTTHLRNIISNAVTAATTPVESAAAAAMDLPARGLHRLAGGEDAGRQRFFGEAAADVVGLGAGLPDGLSGALRAFVEKADEADILADRARPEAFTGAFGKVIGAPSKALAAEDRFFNSLNQQAAAYRMAYRDAASKGLKGEDLVEHMTELLKDPPSAFIQEMERQGKYRTFQQEGGIAESLIKLRNEHPQLRFLLPFVRTPINMMKYALERSPLGYAGIAKDFATKGGRESLVAKGSGDIADRLGRATMGSLILGGLAAYADGGNLTGRAPTDPAERDAFYRQGKQPFSFKSPVDGKWHSYTPLQPYAPLFAAAADASEAIKKDPINGPKDVAGIVALASATAGQSMLDMPWTSGLADALDLVNGRDGQDPVQKINAWTERQAAGLVPGGAAMRTLARAMDDRVRDPSNMLEAAMTNVPGLQERVPEKLDAFGYPVRRPTSGLEVLNPFNPSAPTDDPLEKELARLELKEYNVQPGFPTKNVGFPDDIQVRMTDDQYRDFQRTTGHISYAVLSTLVGSDAWKAMNDQQKAEAVEKVINDVRQVGRDTLKPGMVNEAVQQVIERERRRTEGKE